MARVFASSDAVEPVADTDAEQWGNSHLYGVVSGCGITLDAADLTYDVAAGTAYHNGGLITVAAQTNAGTLVPDATNPRWATIYLDSSGVEGLVHGTAAADPSKPETGDNVELYMILIPAGATIASTISTKLDKRIMGHPQGGLTPISSSTTAATTTSTAAVDLVTLTPAVAIGVNEWAIVEFEYRKTATAAQAVGFGLKINATTVLEAQVTGNSNTPCSSATQRAEAGFARFVIPPRSSANYGFGIDGWFQCFTTAGAIAAGSATSLAGAVAGANMTAVPPQAAITSVTIRAINGTSNNNAEVKNAILYALRTY